MVNCMTGWGTRSSILESSVGTGARPANFVLRLCAGDSIQFGSHPGEFVGMRHLLPLGQKPQSFAFAEAGSCRIPDNA